MKAFCKFIHRKENIMKIAARLKVILAIAGIVSGSSADVIWPADDAWNALMQDSNFYHDAIGDTNPDAIDLVGTTNTYSAGYWALVENGYVDGGVNDDAFMFRLRMGGDGGRSKFNWQVSLDTDGDASDVEWILQLAQSGSKKDQAVELIQTEVGGTTMNDVNTGTNTVAWLGDINLYSRCTAVPGSSDYYVDIAIPWNTFSSITDVAELDQIRALLSTSGSRSGINKDTPFGLSASDPISIVLSDNIPEPAVASLLLGSGLGFLVSRRLFRRRSAENESL
jgi:hypothetical protein